jgi:hypothetical protein
MKSWKTTLGGLLSSLGLLGTQHPDPAVAKFGAALAAFGTLLTGAAARDNGVSSEQAGAKPVVLPLP